MTFRYDFSSVGADFPTAQVAETLLDFKTYLAQNSVPRKSLESSLLMASWNIQHFGGTRRSEEALWYIAEVLSTFDIIAVQEIKPQLDDLETVLALMGPWWRYVVTDVTLGTDGNGERLGYVYDSRKVEFSGLAGELVIPPTEADDGTEIPPVQFDRTPFLAGFSAGWFNFQLATVHLAWATGVAEDPDRVYEAESLAKYMRRRVETDAGTWSRNAFLIGDFNFFNEHSAAYLKLEAQGFKIPVDRDLLTQTNAGADARFYDQIAYLMRDVDVAPTHVGVLDLFEVFYSDQNFERFYEPTLTRADGTVPGNKRSYFRNHYRRKQLSDHFPIWIEIPIDFGESYLETQRD